MKCIPITLPKATPNINYEKAMELTTEHTEHTSDDIVDTRHIISAVAPPSAVVCVCLLEHDMKSKMETCVRSTIFFFSLIFILFNVR